jgi:transcriptional regulator with XRE-family HTH domain
VAGFGDRRGQHELFHILRQRFQQMNFEQVVADAGREVAVSPADRPVNLDNRKQTSVDRNFQLASRTFTVQNVRRGRDRCNRLVGKFSVRSVRKRKDMSAPAKYILGLRHGRGWTQAVVADRTGIAIGRQQVIELGLALPTPPERRAYAKCFEVASTDEFDQGWRSTAVRLSRGDIDGRIPVINLVPAGDAGQYEEVYPNSGIGYAYIDPPPGVCGPNLFAFVIFGDSMEPDFPSGHFAICRPTAPENVGDGEPAFVRFGAARGNGCTFKRCFRVDRNLLKLRAINPAYPPLVVAKIEIDRLAPVIACVPARQTRGDMIDGGRRVADESQAEIEPGRTRRE